MRVDFTNSQIAQISFTGSMQALFTGKISLQRLDIKVQYSILQLSLEIFTCLKLTIKTIEKGVKYVQN